VEILAQVLGRSMMRFIVECLTGMMIRARLRIDREYVEALDQKGNADTLRLVHLELLTLLGLVGALALFLAGALGITFSMEYLRHYYDVSIITKNIVCNILPVIYLLFVLFALIFCRIFSLISAARKGTAELRTQR